jgi:hypothetical protein
MPFHRYATPAYFGGLPGGYDYLNDPADPSVSGSGVPSPVDGKKSGGFNDGTYFVAFGEDARATAANRGLGALGQNTDFLDDVLRTSIPSVTFADATAVGAVATVALVGEIYVGESGASNNQAQRDRLVRVTDQNNNDLEVSGTKIVATLIHDGAAANVIGSQASGFRTNASVNFSPSIPTTTTYRVWYGVRNNFLNISQVDKGALFEEQLRVINNVPGEVRSLLRQVHSEASVNQAWDAAFDSTIRSLASAGLNERYRRATTQPAGFVTGDYNVAGGGAVIDRDGQAVTVKAVDFLVPHNGSAPTAFKDINHALLKLLPEEDRSASAGQAISTNQGGDYGIWHESEWRARQTSDSAERNRTNSAGPVLIEVIPYDMRSATFDGDTHLTYIDATSATAIVNPAAASSGDASRTIQCGAGQHFALGTPLRTAIRAGVDLLEVTHDNGVQVTYVITQVLTTTTVTVEMPTGANPLFDNVAETGCTLRWIQVSVSIGGWLGRNGGLDDTTFARPLLVIPPAILTNDVGSDAIPPCAFFGAMTGSVADAIAGSLRARALEWGGTASPDSGGTVNGNLTARGWLNGDGSANITRLAVTDVTIGDDLVVTGQTTLNETTVDSTGWSVDEFGNAVFDDVEMESLVATDIVVDQTIAVNRPEFYVEFREDWLNFQQDFTPDIVTGDSGVWGFSELTDVFTVNKGLPTAKNPGQIEIIGAGGSTSREFALYKSDLLPFSCASLELVTIVVKVLDDNANVATAMTIGLRDSVSAANGGSDALMIWYAPGIGQWRLLHRVGGSNGTHNATNLGAQVDGTWAVFRFLENEDGDIEIYFNSTLAVTVAVADFPTGLLTFGAYFVQSIADAGATTFTLDYCGARARCGTRSGV